MFNVNKKGKMLSNLYFTLLIIAILFMGIGYASVNSISMDINGTLNAQLQEEIFITEVNYKSSVDADYDSSEIVNFYQTSMNSKVFLSNSNSNSSITYSITIYNKTAIDYSFAGVVYDSEFYDNEDIIFELTNLSIGDKIFSNGYITFDITFTYDNGVVPSSNNNILNSYLNFKFVNFVDYIEGSGTQYIDTGVKPNNNTTFEMNFALTDVNSVQSIYGARTQMDDGIPYNLFFYKRKDDNRFLLRWDESGDGKTYVNLFYNEGKLINFKKNLDNIVVTTNGDTVTTSIPTSEWSLDATTYVFNQNQLSAPENRLGLMRLYDLKIYQNGVLMRDFLPALDINGVAGLYDLISHTFFYNAGTGEFIYKEKSDVKDYIESSGTQYINTEIVADNTTRVEFVMSLNSLSEQTQSIFGARHDQDVNSFNMFWYENKLRWDYYSYKNNLTYESQINTPTFFSVSANEVLIDESVITCTYDNVFSTTYPMYIFSVNTANNAIYLNTGMKLYYFKVYKDDVIVGNFIPAIDENDVPCMYDFISQKYFYNSGTGTFGVS